MDCFLSCDNLIDRRFIHAPTNRAKLKITRNMLLTVTSYHQIMPSFLDFLFSFGAQHHAKDFYYIGFRHNTHLSGPEKVVAIPELGRSDRRLQLCYSLRSVESSPSQEKWPWSIRGTATHHAFDFETGRSSWMIVKGEGGASMKERIKTETDSSKGIIFRNFDECDQAFSSTMSTHLLLCNWSVENWRWYINYIEQEVQIITRKTLSVTDTKPQTEPKPQLSFSRTVSGLLVPPQKTSSFKSPITKKPPIGLQVKMTAAPPPQSPLGPPGPPPLLSVLPQEKNIGSSRTRSEFSFEDLQRIEQLEEHANEALLVLKLNSSVLSAIGQHYDSIMTSTSCPQYWKTKSVTDFRRFANRISDISAENQTQKARLETLLRLLKARKALVCINLSAVINWLMQISCTVF